MNKILFYCFCLISLLNYSIAAAQPTDTLAKSEWQHLFTNELFFSDGNFIYSGRYEVDKNWLHLEARFNNEQLNTFSLWLGYNFSGGKSFQYTITPAVAGLVGELKGIAPGIKFNLGYRGFQLDVESAVIFKEGKKYDFFYNWTDFTYHPLDWLWLGISEQRARLYQLGNDTYIGFLIGGKYRRFEFAGYLYSIGIEKDYFVISLSIAIPEE